MQNSKFKIQNSKSGFTLIEALIAITVLTVSIAGPITIASKSISSAMFARDQITAFYLAQEAVEFIRNRRDENNLQGTGNWLAGNLTLCSGGKVCTIDVVETPGNQISQCVGGSGTCDPLKYDSNTGFYNYSSGNDSIFTREVKLTKIENHEEEITVTLSWRTGITQKTFVVKEHIFDWQ